MHMPKTIHPLAWIKSLGLIEDDHTCPWCGETFSMHFCEGGPVFRENSEHNEPHSAEETEEQ